MRLVARLPRVYRAFLLDSALLVPTLAAWLWWALGGHSRQASAVVVIVLLLQVALTLAPSLPAPRHASSLAPTALAVGVVSSQDSVPAAVWAVLAFAACVTGPFIAPLMARTDRARNLPGYRSAMGRLTARDLAVAALVVALAVAVTGTGFVPWFLEAVAATAMAALQLVIVLRILRVRRDGGAGAIIHALQDYAPQAIVHFSDTGAQIYQVAMWLPYLERLQVPYAVVVRERALLRHLSAVTSVPIVLGASVRELEEVLVPSIRAAFYVNNGTKNTHCVRHPEITHVLLLHGESDKPASFSPVAGIYDKIFVAGQAGAERYAEHGVLIPDEKFVLVGRPQLEELTVGERARATDEAPVVLYAPTWRGFNADADFSSLGHATTIVEGLVRAGASVVFRPHPLSHRDPVSAAAIAAAERVLAASAAATGRPHVWGASAQTGSTIVDCINGADALVTDVSSVAADWLWTGKPFAVTCLDGDAEALIASSPLCRAAAVLDPRSLDTVAATAHEMLGADSSRAVRLAWREHYLGRPGPQSAAEPFLAAVREILASPPARLAAARRHEETQVTTLR